MRNQVEQWIAEIIRDEAKAGAQCEDPQCSGHPIEQAVMVDGQLVAFTCTNPELLIARIVAELETRQRRFVELIRTQQERGVYVFVEPATGDFVDRLREVEKKTWEQLRP